MGTIANEAGRTDISWASVPAKEDEGSLDVGDWRAARDLGVSLREGHRASHEDVVNHHQGEG